MSGIKIMVLILVISFFVFLISSCGPLGESDNKEGNKTGAIEEQQEAAYALGIPIEIKNSIGMRFRLIPAGSFLMGFIGGGRFELPVHKVEITKSFYIGVCEVTQEQWKSVMGTTVEQQRNKAFKSLPLSGEGSKYPIYYVSWEEANEFCRTLSKKDGVIYRLPTEAEWEYACKAGTNTEYYWGSKIDSEYAWYLDNSSGESHPVGQKKPNTWGLHDMSGNVWEWCMDWHGPYSSSSQRDPKGPPFGENHVLRGGSWNHAATRARSSERPLGSPNLRTNDLGFRVVREVE